MITSLRRRHPRRSRPRALSQPQRHQRHRPARLGASRRRGRALSLSARARPRAPHRRIARSRRASSAAIFSYEDIGGREVDDYTYAFVAARRDRGPAPTVARIRRGSSNRRPRTGGAHTRAPSRLVRKDNFVVVAADVFNRRNEREKRYEVRRLERIDGVWTAMDVVMVNDVQRDAHRAGRDERALQHRTDRGRLHAARARAGDALNLPLRARRVPLSLPVRARPRSCSWARSPSRRRANLTEHRQRSRARGSRPDDPAYQDYERFRERVRRHAEPHRRAQERSDLHPEGLQFIDRVDRGDSAGRARRARAKPRHRQHRAAAACDAR